MKKTLFLSALLGLGSSVYAATDCLMPQTIIRVSEGTASQSATSEALNVSIFTKNAGDGDKSVSELMTQAALSVTGNRPAVVKDGQGTLEVTEDVGTLNTTLVVREGTLSIKGATVSTLGSKNGNNLVIGGVNAKMVLSDGASYTFTDSNRTSSSVNVGGIDGDGTLILTGGSSLSTRQTLFSGTATTLPIPTGDDPYWEVGPHQGGTYTKVDGADNNVYYRVATNAAGYSNQTTTPRGSLAGTAVITVEDGSTLTTGTGFYVYNTTMTVDNATVKTGTVNNTDNVWIGSSDVFGPTSKAVLTIQNGGQWLAQNGQYAAISYNVGEQSEVTISGEGSLMQVDGLCYLGSTNTTRSDIRILDGGEMKFGGYLYSRGSADSSHTLLVDGDGSTLSAQHFYLYGATSLTVRDGGLAQATHLVGNRSDVAVAVENGGELELSGELAVSHGASLQVTGNSVVSAKNAWVESGAVASIADGATVTVDQWVTNAAQLSLTGGSELHTVFNVLQGNASVMVDNDSALHAYKNYLYEGATLMNHGTLSHLVEEGDAVDSMTYLYGGSRIQTGEVLVSGCEELVGEGHSVQSDYTTGLGSNMSLLYGSQSGEDGDETDSGTVTLGALLTGKNEMQYLGSADMQKINEAVFAGLALGENAAYTIAYKHEIGENITVNYTTDHLNNVNGTESIAVKGGAILVEQGEGEHHIGTIGSYAKEATETGAAIAVHEQTSGSKVTWEGTELQTVAGERALIAEGNQVTVAPSTPGDGKLTVVGNSALRVQGSITADGIIVESGASMTNNGVLYAGVTVEGTLNGSGTINGSVTLSSGGTLIVGNSPGYQIVSSAQLEGNSTTVFCIAGTTASSEGHAGWASGTASQLCITEGALTLSADACITIEFGGSDMVKDAWNGQMQGFVVTLVQGGCEELTAGQLSNLLANTTFKLTEDADGLLGLSMPSLMGVTVYNARYEVVGADLVLRGDMKLTPEPATATLSLLALAGLAARRRRK